jgi:hypothetical protein
MSAFDTFHGFNTSLSASERDMLRDLIKTQTEELLAARSEDARVRIVRNYIKDARTFLQHRKTKTTT